ncbi:hypothetical protein D3C80_1075270 [compost metagenome]
MLHQGHVRAEHATDHQQRQQAQGQVDVEDPVPRQVFDQEATNQWPHHRGQAEHAAEQALVAATFGRRDDIADGGHRHHHQAAATQPLQGAEGDQLGHVLCCATQGRAQQEQHDGHLQHTLAAELVTELAIQRYHYRGGQQVSGDHPRQPAQPTEVADDGWQCGRDDGLVEGGQEHHQHQGCQQQRDGGLRVRCGGGSISGYRLHSAYLSWGWRWPGHAAGQRLAGLQGQSGKAALQRPRWASAESRAAPRSRRAGRSAALPTAL